MATYKNVYDSAIMLELENSDQVSQKALVCSTFVFVCLFTCLFVLSVLPDKGSSSEKSKEVLEIFPNNVLRLCHNPLGNIRS